jgi:hypothetical protein
MNRKRRWLKCRTDTGMEWAVVSEVLPHPGPMLVEEEEDCPDAGIQVPTQQLLPMLPHPLPTIGRPGVHLMPR